MDTFDELLREALNVCALLCFPVLIAATAVGTLVAIAQAATQVQEQTLTMLPKLAVVALIIAMFGGFALDLCGGLFRDAVVAMPRLVGH